MCVIAGHSIAIFGLPTLDARLAVKTFFLISGFYMTLILTSKYHTDRGGTYWLFISNRFLRIYPSYLVVLAVSLLFYAIASIRLHAPADRLAYWVEAWRGHHYGALGLLSVSQLSIFGMDATPLFDFSPSHGFTWAGNSGDASVSVWRFNFLSQCWSVSVELIFYLAAPLICVARRWVQMALMVAGLAAYLAAVKWLPGAVADLAVTSVFFCSASCRSTSCIRSLRKGASLRVGLGPCFRHSRGQFSSPAGFQGGSRRQSASGSDSLRCRCSST
jgi:peptidoglycan/LPS O-acetylase OafA/YrhL